MRNPSDGRPIPTFAKRACVAVGALVAVVAGGSCSSTRSSVSAEIPAPSDTIAAGAGTIAAEVVTSASAVVVERPLPPTTPPLGSEVPRTTFPPVPPSPSVADSTVASTTVPPRDAAACIGALPLGVRAAQVLMPAVYGDALGSGEAVVDDVGVGWLILMTWPDGANGDRLRGLKTRTQIPVLIATDEEGGNVQRLRRLGKLPSPAEMASSHSVAEAEQTVAQHAQHVSALGIDVVFAPVVDVGDAAPIGSRSFGSDPATVAAYGAAYARAWLSAGVTPVLKHFPGHGRASADTHAAPAVTPAIDDLRAVDFVPYREVAGHPGVGVMVGHLTVPDVTEGLPASLSRPAIQGLLRDELGFTDALVFTDALGMGAVEATQGLSDAAVTSLAAGADVLVFTNTSDARRIRDRIVAAVDGGALSESRLDEAVGRVLSRKGVDPCGLSF